MSAKTKAKRAEKEAKRLPSRYVSPVKLKRRELLWQRYKRFGLKYDPYQPTPQAMVEATTKAPAQAELPLEVTDAGNQ